MPPAAQPGKLAAQSSSTLSRRTSWRSPTSLRGRRLLRDARNAETAWRALHTRLQRAHALALAALRSAATAFERGASPIVFQVLEFTADAPKALSLALAQYHDRATGSNTKALLSVRWR